MRDVDRHALGKRNAKDRQKEKHLQRTQAKAELSHEGEATLRESEKSNKYIDKGLEISDRRKEFREWVMIGLVACTAIFTALTYLVFKDQLKDSHVAYADVQRAFIFQTRFENFCVQNGCMLTPIWENSGSTPSEHLIISDNASVVPLGANPAEFKYNLPGISAKSLIGPHGIALGRSLFVTSEQIKDILSGKSQFWVWGRATYRDVFDKSEDHITCFAYSVNPNLASSKDPKSNKTQTSIVNVSMIGLGVHNCSDKDCKDDPCSQ